MTHSSEGNVTSEQSRWSGQRSGTRGSKKCIVEPVTIILALQNHSSSINAENLGFTGGSIIFLKFSSLNLQSPGLVFKTLLRTSFFLLK